MSNCKILTGPILELRDIQRSVKGSRADQIKVELQALEDFGGVGELRTGRRRKQVFYKPEPSALSENNHYLHRGNVTLDEYRAKFLDLTKTTQQLLDHCLANHPHSELLNDLQADEESDEKSDEENAEESDSELTGS
ncbi:uncharacterized protein LOC141899000 [Tubulanus polymorphus]|uniref:uncharacterized protein LOC141899000 n=1 Tax=Tubulanus polymorphus TaxID=672921 RepID=UPI003DA387BF